jgi:type IV fimbrial biogenesis protein FimT
MRLFRVTETRPQDLGQRGFTLIELIVTVAVLAIVVAMAAPAFNGMIANNRSAGMASELVATLNYARSESIRQAKRVSICPSTNGTSCLASADDWAKGWLVFVDLANSDSAAVSVGTVLRYWDKLDKKAVVSLKKKATAISYLRFNSKGMLARSKTSDTDVRTFEAYVSGCRGDAGRRITVGVTGFVSSSKSTCP